jgi:4-deoxy-L-threo-5-hexosulose-uronate ketol-isomerase
MEIRQPMHSEHARPLDTAGLRRHFHVERTFVPGKATLTCSRIDRIIGGGICPASVALAFAPELGRHTGTDYFRERREPGLVNIGGDAVVTVDGTSFARDAGRRAGANAAPNAKGRNAAPRIVRRLAP